MTEVYIGLGSNLGDKKQNIEEALEYIKEKCEILKISSLYETEPVGYKDQDWFLNGVVKIGTHVGPQELLGFILLIEKRLGRVRTIKNGPRIIDLDILFYGNEIINEPNLIVPHPRLHERGFVLVPLQEVAPDLMHPIFRKTIQELLSNLGDEKVVTKILRP